ncbi:FKBP-type peptidyl-prolyl cis-trans isomerase [Kineobactrum salinum]|uniref:Peptidyl-prolyl cis-trans isomerase n=1 Tax=Kineobactrum salinum TaxID=2708301 RepID=A0A6C0U1Z9_9GAMM|nr:FKBP-type peptidyl-prolyl cis-trans isomerase [Kineobactrum salinum]QIB66046.1 FKBP-type peptidyl-prolyl cis-trans isomerase [Kineobactrum salinum]
MLLQPEVELATDEQKVSYGFGLQFGDQLRRNQFEGLDLEAVMAGMQHWYCQQQSLIADGDLNPSYDAIKARQQALAEEVSARRRQLAGQFLQANAAREEVSTTASGLQYEVLEAGSGEPPAARSTVLTHYHGSFVDGTVFDSSVQRGEPVRFGVHEVIPGWTEALQLMRPGARWRIVCPPALAYGDQGAGEAIPPGTVLVFEIQLLKVLD